MEPGRRREGLSLVHLGSGMSAAFKGRATQVDIEIEGARPPSSCEGSLRAVRPVILAETLRETRHEADLFGRVIAKQKEDESAELAHTTSGP